MARVNVNELLGDPDFIDPVGHISRAPAVNSFGENILKEVCVMTVGSVQPATGKALQRLPEALRVADVSSFWIKGPIVASAPGQYTDILVFRNKRYQVQFVFDWTNWGEGFTEGTCVAEPPA